MKKYSEERVVELLGRRHDLRIVGKQIQELRGDMAKGDVGINSRGKIDFLVNYCGYNHFYVNKFNYEGGKEGN